MALVSTSCGPLTCCLIQHPYYILMKSFFKSASFSGRWNEYFSSLRLLSHKWSVFIRKREEKHTTKICMTAHYPSLPDLYAGHLKYVHFCIQSQNSPFILSGMEAIMKCVGPPSDTFLIKPMCLWVEKFWLRRRGTVVWSANLPGSRKQSQSSHLLKPFNHPVLSESYCLFSASWQGRCVCDNVHHLGCGIQEVILYSVTALGFLSGDSTALYLSQNNYTKTPLDEGWECCPSIHG